MRPILLLSSVCALLIAVNCDKSGIKCDKGYKGYQGYVSLFHRPTRHESRSTIQNSSVNCDKTGINCDKSGLRGLRGDKNDLRGPTGSFVLYYDAKGNFFSSVLTFF